MTQPICPDRASQEDPLELAIERGAAFIRKQQLPSGAWIAMSTFEPQTSALHLVTLAFIDRVPLVDARGYARFLASLQREDGSFPAYPFAETGDLSATALVYAALRVADLDEQRPLRARALAYIEGAGGFAAVVRRLYDAGDTTALSLAMVGLVDPFELPDPHLSFMLVPSVLDAMLRKINGGVVQTMIYLAAVTRALRERQRPSPAPLRWVHEREARRCIAFMEGWLNPNGNNNGTTVQTDMAIATLVALGRTPESKSVHSAIQWFGKHQIWDADGLHLRAFFNQSWVTAWSLRALLAAGVGRDDPAIADGLDYLCWSQSKLPMPEVNLRRENAHRVGGWAFEEDNLLLPDTDDTGIVLSALGLALDSSPPGLESKKYIGAEGSDSKGKTPLDSARRARVEHAVRLGLDNLLDMQSDDGGWAGFVWNLGSKGPGPLFDKPLALPSSIADAIRFFQNPPLELGEVPVEGLTGRVLQGLGANGFDARSLVVQNAARFLEQRQMADGSFWARWLVGYVTATASVLSGLAACGWNMNAPWVERAIAWLLSKQNEDGGWGETVAAFENPHAGIESPSMPPLTAVALIALVDAGHGDDPAVERAVRYLLSTQTDAGTWPLNGWVQIFQPYASYYSYEGATWYRPVEALSRVLAFRRERGRLAHAVSKRSCARVRSSARTVFVAGGTGFIGSAFVVERLRAGDRVRVLARSARSKDAAARLGAEVVDGDLLREGPWQDAARAADFVVHLAQPRTFGGRVTARRAEQYRDERLTMDEHLLGCLDGGRTERIVYVSGTSYYGDLGTELRDETATPRPRGFGPYIVTAVERLAGWLQRGLPLVQAFPGYIYGPGSWFAEYLYQPLASGKKLSAISGRSRHASTMHVDDCGRALAFLLQHGAVGQRYFLVDDRPVTWSDVHALTAEALGVEPRVRSVPPWLLTVLFGPIATSTLMSDSVLSNAKLKSLGFELAYPTIEDGLPGVIADLRREPRTKRPSSRRAELSARQP